MADQCTKGNGINYVRRPAQIQRLRSKCRTTHTSFTQMKLKLKKSREKVKNLRNNQNHNNLFYKFKASKNTRIQIPLTKLGSRKPPYYKIKSKAQDEQSCSENVPSQNHETSQFSSHYGFNGTPSRGKIKDLEVKERRITKRKLSLFSLSRSTLGSRPDQEISNDMEEAHSNFKISDVQNHDTRESKYSNSEFSKLLNHAQRIDAICSEHPTIANLAALKKDLTQLLMMKQQKLKQAKQNMEETQVLASLYLERLIGMVESRIVLTLIFPNLEAVRYTRT